MEQTTLKSFYDELFESFHSDCIEIGHLEHLAGTDVFVIAVGVKEQITSLITYLNQGQEKPDHIYMIVQKNMIPVVSDLENEQCHFIEWNGPYTLDVIRYVEERINLTAVRHLFYQGRQPLDLRNVNLYDILLGIKINIKIIVSYTYICRIFRNTFIGTVHRKGSEKEWMSIRRSMPI